MSTQMTINDILVQESLRAVETYKRSTSDYTPAIIGGIANQLYTFPHYPDLLRPTSDLDVSITPRLHARSFREDVGKNIALLLDGFQPEISVHRHVYEVKVQDAEENLFFIHSYALTVKGYERQRRNIEREVSNANTVSLPNSSGTVSIVRPEDLIYGKMRRLKILERRKTVKEVLHQEYHQLKQRDWTGLAAYDVHSWLAGLIRQKDLFPVMWDRGESSFREAKEEYIASKDLFDIAVLAKLIDKKLVGFDEGYFDRILSGKE